MTPYQSSLAIAGLVHLSEMMGALLSETFLTLGRPSSDNIEALVSMQLVGGVVSAPINALAMAMAMSLPQQSQPSCSIPLAWGFVGAGGLVSLFFQANLGKMILDALGQVLHRSLLKEYSSPLMMSEQNGLLLVDGLGVFSAIMLLLMAYPTYSLVKQLLCQPSRPVEAQAMLIRPLMAHAVLHTEYRLPPGEAVLMAQATVFGWPVLLGNMERTSLQPEQSPV